MFVHFKVNTEMRAGDESDYEAAVHGCTLADDVEISRADSGDLDPEQSYWISGKQLELGCQPRGTPHPHSHM